MQVTLIDHTGCGSPNPGRHAANVLLFTKSTRLEMNAALMRTIAEMPDEEVLFNLRVMAGTNPGSWEFVHFSFFVQDVTRAFTHQLVRTRQASYAQQTMRVVEMVNWRYETGPSIINDTERKNIYDQTMKAIDISYKELIKAGALTEDARGLLPTNILTNICVSMNMRNFISFARKRTSARVQNEHRHVVDAMVIELEKVFPWFYIFYKSDEMKAYKDLLDMLYDNEDIKQEDKLAMYKKIDLIKSGIE